MMEEREHMLQKNMCQDSPTSCMKKRENIKSKCNFRSGVTRVEGCAINRIKKIGHGIVFRRNKSSHLIILRYLMNNQVEITIKYLEMSLK